MSEKDLNKLVSGCGNVRPLTTYAVGVVRFISSLMVSVCFAWVYYSASREMPSDVEAVRSWASLLSSPAWRKCY